MLSRQDEKICLVQIFFYCLDYVSRLQKNCSEYSGKLKHASAMDSVLKLSLKMMGNRWMFRRCSPIIYTCLPPEIHPHGQNGTITREIINIIKKTRSCHRKQLNKQPLRFLAPTEQKKSWTAYTPSKPGIWTAYHSSNIKIGLSHHNEFLL